jgi:hypothetical protein
MKLDVEGAEYIVMPALILSGALCHIDLIFAEWHEGMTNPGSAKITKEDTSHAFKSMRVAHPAARSNSMIWMTRHMWTALPFLCKVSLIARVMHLSSIQHGIVWHWVPNWCWCCRSHVPTFPVRQEIWSNGRSWAGHTMSH